MFWSYLSEASDQPPTEIGKNIPYYMEFFLGDVTPSAEPLAVFTV